jgi:hypothetical protein
VLTSGVVAGFPVVDVKVQLVDGKYHDVDSSALAFEVASRAAFREALTKGKSVLLEPIMKVEVVTPEDYTGSVIGDLNSRRGQIQGQALWCHSPIWTVLSNSCSPPVRAAPPLPCSSTTTLRYFHPKTIHHFGPR